MIQAIRDDLLRVSAAGVGFYVLKDKNDLFLIDCGFIGGRGVLREALRMQHWDHLQIRGLILSHGHLDHILNVSAIARETGAWIAAPRLDQRHYEGRPVYRGLSRVTGCTESVGRTVLGFRPFTPDRLLDDGDEVDVWHGLTTIQLPGHTAGHSGYYCEKLKLLFSTDLFASFRYFSHLPPRLLNQASSAVRISVGRALQLELSGVLPVHADRAAPEVHLQRLRKLHQVAMV